MQIPVWMCAILFVIPLVAQDRMTVSICTRGVLDGRVVAGAENTTTSLFQRAGIEVAWAPCEAGLQGDEAAQQHWFTLRLWDGRPFIPSSAPIERTLGEAFLTEETGPYLAEVYYEAVSGLAESHSVEFPALLGYVIAHELCHLLLGPKHTTQGVMRAMWDLNDLAGISQGRLKFNHSDGVRMRRVLQTSPSRAN